MAKPRVFVSSVVDGFTDYRDAARRGILAIGAEPVLVNEDYPALALSPRNACLDGVDSCDVHLCIIGPRGGLTAPSGALVTEEEYEQARLRCLPILVFILQGEKDAEAQAFAARISDYVDGQFRVTVADPADLEQKVQTALEPVLTTLTFRMTPEKAIADELRDNIRNRPHPVLRTVICPERMDEVIDPMLLDDRSFIQRVYELGHRPDVGLLDYRLAKKDRVSVDRLVIKQHENSVGIELATSGLALFEIDVSGASVERLSDAFTRDLYVLTGELTRAAVACLAFYVGLFEEADPFGRHQTFLFNAALLGLNYRSIVGELPTSQSHPMRMALGDDPIVAFQTPRKLSRQLLRQPEGEIERLVAMLSRHSQE